MFDKKNSRNTENPYELIAGVKLISKSNKNISVSIQATNFSYDSDKKGKKHLVMTNFNVSTKYSIENNNDYATAKVLKSVEKFAKLSKNPLEVITIFVDAYKKNKGKLIIKIKTCPAYPDMMDSKFVYNELLND